MTLLIYLRVIAYSALFIHIADDGKGNTMYHHNFSHHTSIKRHTRIKLIVSYEQHAIFFMVDISCSSSSYCSIKPLEKTHPYFFILSNQQLLVANEQSQAKYDDGDACNGCHNLTF